MSLSMLSIVTVSNVVAWCGFEFLEEEGDYRLVPSSTWVCCVNTDLSLGLAF